MNGKRTYQHAEAFCVMKYASKDGSVVEYLWNSRDGVTPFVIHSPDGVEMAHVDWQDDRFDFNHVCKPGDRIFVDMTTESAQRLASASTERFWDEGLRDMFATKDDAIAMYLEGIQRGAPDIYTVQEGDHYCKPVHSLTSLLAQEPN